MEAKAARMFAKIRFGWEELKALIDGKRIDPKAKTIQVANGTTSTVLGRGFLLVELDGVKQQFAFRIASEVIPDCILG